MRRFKKPLAVTACLSLLLLQSAGVHVHADDSGYVGVPEASFAHSHNHPDHDAAHHAGAESMGHAGPGVSDHTDDYEGERDVSLLDLALGVFKMPLAVLTLVLLFAFVSRARTLAGIDFVFPILSGRHTRWRPPLRAPPQPA
jgi:hypothetical protein